MMITQKDMKQLLALPSFIEKHCHLDKTLLSDQWRAVTPVNNIFERCEIEKRYFQPCIQLHSNALRNYLVVMCS